MTIAACMAKVAAAERTAMVPPKAAIFNVGECRRCGVGMPGSLDYDLQFGKLLCDVCRVPGTAPIATLRRRAEE